LQLALISIAVNILVFNAGSSSYKCALYQIGNALPPHPPEPRWQAAISWTEVGSRADLRLRDKLESFASPLEALRHALTCLPTDNVAVIGQRVVHGGPNYRAPVRVNAAVKGAIREYASFAPAHNPAALAAIELAEQHFPAIPQFAFFDTAFHRTLSEAARFYPGPYEWVERGFVRFGFHGISHAYCAERAAEMLGRPAADLRLITCHLGNGCSLCAIRYGRSVDTTMGFTPLEGLMMGSRAGSIDPGLLLHLASHGSSADELDTTLNRRSGLLGTSGVSSDMREVLKARAEGNARAALAFDMFIHRLRFHIGAMAAALDRLDALVFTAGIGEHSPEVRAAACANFAWLGLRLDPQRNDGARPDADVSAAESSIRVLVLSTEEDWAIARQCWRLTVA
jgi:acetate kinase